MIDSAVPPIANFRNRLRLGSAWSMMFRMLSLCDGFNVTSFSGCSGIALAPGDRWAKDEGVGAG